MVEEVQELVAPVGEHPDSLVRGIRSTIHLSHAGFAFACGLLLDGLLEHLLILITINIAHFMHGESEACSLTYGHLCWCKRVLHKSVPKLSDISFDLVDIFRRDWEAFERTRKHQLGRQRRTFGGQEVSEQDGDPDVAFGHSRLMEESVFEERISRLQLTVGKLLNVLGSDG